MLIKMDSFTTCQVVLSEAASERCLYRLSIAGRLKPSTFPGALGRLLFMLYSTKEILGLLPYSHSGTQMKYCAPLGGIEPPQHWLTASSSAIELHGISWGAGLLFTSEGLRAYYLSTAPCHTCRPLSLLPAKASVHNLYRRTQRRLLCQPRLDCTV